MASQKLGLEPVDEQPEGFLYRCGGSEFALFRSVAASSGEHTQMVREVEDLAAVVGELRDRGVVFEEYDFPGLTTVAGIANLEGGWSSKGGNGLRVAWFRDSEGNLLSIAQQQLLARARARRPPGEWGEGSSSPRTARALRASRRPASLTS